MEYEAVIGLETHVQLKTKSKMWCGCANQYGSEPNTNVCPVCLGMPGVLPVPNDEALRLTVLTGFLLNCEIPRFAKFDRKSYFYPDAPKNYQLTQYDKPSTQNGFVDFEFTGAGSVNGMGKVRITRAHLEEDVGKLTHFDRNSGVDFNRAGVPLMEIVSEPDITSADMAYEYLNALKDILIYGNVSDCDMEKGMVRCDVNISVRPVGTKELGAKIEIKNMNSFSGVRRAAGIRDRAPDRSGEARRTIDPVHAPLGRRSGHHRRDAHEGTRARLPLFSRSRPDAARADGRVAGRSEIARRGIAARAQAAFHARVSIACAGCGNFCERRAARKLF